MADDPEITTVLCPTCGMEVVPDEEERCPHDHTDLHDLIEEDESDAKLAKNHGAAFRRAMGKVRRLRNEVGHLKRQVADDSVLVALKAAKDDLAAKVATLQAQVAAQYRRPQADSLGAATADLREIAARRRREWS